MGLKSSDGKSWHDNGILALYQLTTSIASAWRTWMRRLEGIVTQTIGESRGKKGLSISAHHWIRFSTFWHKVQAAVATSSYELYTFGVHCVCTGP